MDRQTLLDLIPAYALGALDPEDHAAVEAFLKTDAEAQKLLADYQAVTDLLVLTTPARRAPAHLGADLRERLAASRPGTAPSKPAIPLDEPKVIPVSTQRSWLSRAMGLAAALVVFVAGILLLARGQPSAEEQLYNQIVAQADARRFPIQAANWNAGGEMVATADGKQAVIKVERLPVVLSHRVLQLWLIDAGGPHSAGLVPTIPSPEKVSYIIVPLPKPVTEYTNVGLSEEPKGGSQQPTADKILFLVPVKV
jgi:anti-sigma factor RsiW